MFGLHPLSSTWNLNIMFNFRGVSLLPDSPRFVENVGIQGYEHLLEQIARIPRLGSLNLACRGAELVVPHTLTRSLVLLLSLQDYFRGNQRVLVDIC